MTGGFPKSASALAIAAAAGLLASSLSLAPSKALAADLGGDCCADLEERVANLEVTTVRKGNKKVSLTISGRVHANIMYWNDNFGASFPNDPGTAFDHNSDVYFGNAASSDSNAAGSGSNRAGSGSNIVLNGTGKVTSDLSAGFLMTLSDDFGGTNNQISHQTGPSLLGDTTYVFLSSRSLGELRLGNMTSASDIASYLNFGAATVGGLAGGRFTGDFRLRNTAGKLTDVTYSQILHEWSDKNENRLMYISPNLGGFKLYADIGGDDTASAALAWVGKFNTVNVEAGIGYQTSTRIDGVSHQAQFTAATASTAFVALTGPTANDNLRELGLSGSIYETNSGLFLSGEYSRAYSAIATRQDISNWFVEGGWQKNVSGAGLTSIYAQYMVQYNGLKNDTQGHLFGVGIDQAIDSAASNVYLHYQRDSYDTDGGIPGGGVGASTATGLANNAAAGAVNSQAIDSVTGGMIIHF